MLNLWVSGFAFGVGLCHFVNENYLWGISLTMLSLVNWLVFLKGCY